MRGFIHSTIGGAFYFDFSNDLNIFSRINVFDGNEAGMSGGAVFSGCKNVGLVMAATFRSNTARVYGGAVALLSFNLATVVTDSYFEYNSAGEAGGAVHSALSNTGLLLKESEFWENTAVSYGGASSSWVVRGSMSRGAARRAAVVMHACTHDTTSHDIT
jgi:predicted outer membrane repeat protein